MTDEKDEDNKTKNPSENVDTTEPKTSSVANEETENTHDTTGMFFIEYLYYNHTHYIIETHYRRTECPYNSGERIRRGFYNFRKCTYIPSISIIIIAT